MGSNLEKLRDRNAVGRQTHADTAVHRHFAERVAHLREQFGSLLPVQTALQPIVHWHWRRHCPHADSRSTLRRAWPAQTSFDGLHIRRMEGAAIYPWSGCAENRDTRPHRSEISSPCLTSRRLLEPNGEPLIRQQNMPMGSYAVPDLHWHGGNRHR